jgi:all-trans-retinol dehydrogenase (NAD+)
MSSCADFDIVRVRQTSFLKLKVLFSLAVDATLCVFLAIPLMWNALLKTIFVRRKCIRGKLVLVTGGGQGLGRAISLKLAEMGCDIAVADLNEETARSVAEEVKQKGVQAKGYKVDISKNDETRKLREDIKNDFGPVDILINNAGVIPDMSNEVKPGFLETMIKVNVLGTILMTRAILDQMRQNGGHIVTISSMSGLHASPFAVPYSATKAAVNSFMSGLTEKLRLEKLGDKIKLTCICPYYVTTRKDIVDFLNPE